MYAYTCPKLSLPLIASHLANLDIEILSLVLIGDVYTFTTNAPFDEVQYPHLAQEAGLSAIN